jgi:hypothetical protein
VDQSTLDAYFAGELTPPMMVFVWRQGLYAAEPFGESPSGRLKDFLGAKENVNYPDIEAFQQEAYPERPPLPFVDSWFQPTAAQNYEWLMVIFGILTSYEDWEANAAMYEAMLDYPQAHLYYTSPDQLHTLFLNYNWQLDYVPAVLEIPFGEDWQESTDLATGAYVLAPIDADENTPTWRLLSAETFYDGSEMRGPYPIVQALEAMLTWAETEYAVELPSASEAHSDICVDNEPLEYPFTQAGREGVLYIVPYYLLVIEDVQDPTLMSLYEITRDQLWHTQLNFACPRG